MVGSWVEIITRTPKCRCCRIIDSNDSVNAFEAGVLVIYYTWSCFCSDIGVDIEIGTYLVCLINSNDLASSQTGF